MSSDNVTELLALVYELLEEAETDVEGEIDADRPLITSGLLDSLSLLSLAEWVSLKLERPLDLSEVDLRAEWDTAADIVAYIERRRRLR